MEILILFELEAEMFQNFFSSHFVYTTAQGDLGVSTDAWLLAAIAIPLTAATIAFWGLWVCWTNRTDSNESPNASMQELSRFGTIRRILSTKGSKRSMDIEMGAVSPQSTLCASPHSMQATSGFADISSKQVRDGGETQ